MDKEYYFDNSATSNPKPKAVLEKVQEALISFNGNPGRSGYKKAVEIDRAIYNVRVKIAEFFNIKDPLKIAFTSNASESLNFAVKGAGLSDCHIISSVLEHNSVLRPLHYLRDEKNVSLSFVSPHKDSEDFLKEIKSLINEKTKAVVLNHISRPLHYLRDEKNVSLSFVSPHKDSEDFLKEIKSLINEKTKAVVLNHISNVTGYIADIEAVGKLCREKNLLFIVDASQSAGFLKIDVEKFNIDILCFTGHKSLFGIQGTGGIYIREGISLNPLLEGGTGSFSKFPRQPDRMPELLECGTLNTPGILSLGAGIDFINSVGLENIKNHEYALTKRFIDKISEIKNITIYGYKDIFRGAVVSLNIKNISSSDLSAVLDEEFNICTRSGFHCAPLAHKFYDTYETGMVRFSFGYFNTAEEIDYAAEALKEICSEL